jgi:threonine/homoserine/homoserine lactone efflux protein
VRPDAALCVPAQICVLAAIGIGSELVVLLGYAAAAARAAALARSRGFLAAFERASGACLIGCAALAAAA